MLSWYSIFQNFRVFSTTVFKYRECNPYLCHMSTDTALKWKEPANFISWYLCLSFLIKETCLSHLAYHMFFPPHSREPRGSPRSQCLQKEKFSLPREFWSLSGLRRPWFRVSYSVTISIFFFFLLLLLPFSPPSVKWIRNSEIIPWEFSWFRVNQSLRTFYS